MTSDPQVQPETITGDDDAGAEHAKEAHPTVVLRSLAPAYLPDHHAAYVRHLENAVCEPRNRNIALTGRYGSGKSSVLDEFERQHAKDTVRISINTLGPDENDEDLTNRIQKELVKQLVYRAEPGVLRRSRFARHLPLTRGRAMLDAAVVTAVGLLLLWLVGVRPGDTWFGATPDPVWTGIWIALFVAVVMVAVFALRMLIGDRIVSQVSTAGTTITLGDRPTTYFDGYLDEIVEFFHTVEPSYVIFEDLDRFDDPQIFDSLRELNTLINASALWAAKKRPLRFIYAIKDSLFEKIGTDLDLDMNHDIEDSEDNGQAADAPAERAKRAKIDLAAAAVDRANRTKFFEVVIPVVPFISHRNARDLLADTFDELGLKEDLVSRRLLDLVARHTTDMRLLINICNEFAVFAEQLLWVDNRAPGIAGDDLFALVAYKNFHLSDFEAIAQRTSSLDRLEEHHRTTVRRLIKDLQQKRRDRALSESMRRRRHETAESLGRQLSALVTTLNGTGNRYKSFEVGGVSYAPEQTQSPEFWQSVAHAAHIVFRGSSNNIVMSGDDLVTLLPQSKTYDDWLEPSSEEFARLLEEYDRDVATLRGADFKALVEYERTSGQSTPFADSVAEELDSELGRDLILRGFITRNYAEYSARFYGSFVGVDVAFYYNHSVQPNRMYVDHHFTTPNAVANLLEQVPSDFTSSVSVLNLEILDHLLKKDVPSAKRVASYLASDFSLDARTFLDAVVNAGPGSREQFMGMLAATPWRQVFEFICTDAGMPDEITRLELLDTALLHSEDAGAYELEQEFLTWFSRIYGELKVVTSPQGVGRTAKLYSFFREADIVVSDLSSVAEPLRKRIVNAERYELTDPNLRLALGVTSMPTLDVVLESPQIWSYVAANPIDYVEALRKVDAEASAVTTDHVLASVLSERIEEWDDDDISTIIDAAAPEASLSDITAVPQECWAILAAAARMTPSFSNIHSYVQELGFDLSLSSLLTNADGSAANVQGTNELDSAERMTLAVKILNAEGAPATIRADIASQLDLQDYVVATALTPRPDNLLARMLERDLLPDDESTLVHFATAGWDAVGDAFGVSKHVGEFLSPQLVSGLVPQLLQSENVPEAIRTRVAEDVATFVPTDQVEALRAVGIYAVENRVKLAFDQVARIARITRDPRAVLPHLVRDRELTAQQLVDVLSTLDSPYSTLASGYGQEFDLPEYSSARTLLERLQQMGRVEIFNRGWGHGKGVRVLT